MTTQELIALLTKLDKEAHKAPWSEISPKGKAIVSGHYPIARLSRTDEPGFEDVADTELIVTLRNNLNTILQWGRVVEAAKELKEVVASGNEQYYNEGYDNLFAALSLIEE